VHKMSLEEVDNLPDSVRGKGGFGSTGKWKNN
jgi:dUTPase